MYGSGRTASDWRDVRPTAEQARRYRKLGVWRDETPAADLRWWARETPDAVAITAYRSGSGVRRFTYREYLGQVESFAVALRGLGVRPGEVVAVQLPNWWEVNALVVACARLGAIVAPIGTPIRNRELGLMLARLGAVACVTVDQWDGFDHSAALAEMAPRLPALRHRIVLGERINTDEVDLTRIAEEARSAADRLDESAEDPDRVSVVMFTSGTSGVPKAALHTFNTFHAGCSTRATDTGFTSADVVFTPNALTHAVGQTFVNLLPLYVGGQGLVSDTADPDIVVDLMTRYEVTSLLGAPVFLASIAEAAGRRSQQPAALKRVVAGASVIPAELVDLVADRFGLALLAGWGMTEVVGTTLTSPTDPPDWAVHSVGRPNDALETDLRGDAGEEISAERPARLFVRGGSVCLATMGRDDGEPQVLADHDDGWYDTGDLAVPDGRGGIKLAGRAADRIGGVLMIPVADVEDALRTHPDVTDVALVGYGDNQEHACAVVVASAPVTLEDLRSFLTGIGMTGWYQPTWLEIVPALPRNATGKVRKELLRRWLRGETEMP